METQVNRDKYFEWCIKDNLNSVAPEALWND